MGVCFGGGDDAAGRIRHEDGSVRDNLPCPFTLEGAREWRVRADAGRAAYAGTHVLHRRSRGDESVRSVRDPFQDAMEGRSPDHDVEHERVWGDELRG